MRHYNDTVRALSEITDTGLFEHLATAVLRSARPELYRNLTQPGVNADAKPVKSPVDAISFVIGCNPPHMVAAHHTTCAQEDLRKKWLHDPSTVLPRKGSKPAAPAGDVIKTAAVADDDRARIPDLCVTLVLTTNKESPEDVTREAERVALSRKIVLDIWSRSRIAHYLDNDANGQWLRRQYLYIEQERLSRDLLRELSKRSLETHHPKVRETECIYRMSAEAAIGGLTRPVGFLVGESGFGKSVACYQQLAQHIEKGGCGLVLPHETLESSVTLDQAIDGALRQLHPALVLGAGAEARSLCSEDSPLLIIVEDVSRSGKSALLIERLAKWAASHKNDRDTVKSGWRLVCPIWPGVFSAISEQTRKHVEPLAVPLGPFTHDEARASILRRAELEGVELTALDADVVAERLGYDPLLIGICDLKNSAAARTVIGGFISRRTEQLANGDGMRAACEYALALRSLSDEMLERRKVDPSWNEVTTWFSSLQDQLVSLRELIKHGEIIRVIGANHDAQLSFRHDRIYKWLLTDAAIQALREHNLDDAILSEPFFSDVVGNAIADPTMPPSVADRARLSNPLALFHALHSFREPAAQAHYAVLAGIDSWLSDEASHTRTHQSLRYAALHVLSDTQSTKVQPILTRFRDRSWSGPLAGLRNGDFKSGIRLCYSLGPGSGAEWRDRAIEHAKVRYGSPLIQELDDLLRRQELTGVERIGGLRLAGHLADTALAGAIAACWGSDKDRQNYLGEYLWAAAQCGGERTAQLLAPVCDGWAALSDQRENGNPSPRDSVAAYDVAWAFWRGLPSRALAFFMQRATQEDLRWQITYMVHGVDHPDVVAFVVAELAARARKQEDTGGILHFSNNVRDHWQRRQRDGGKPMSAASREQLKELWSNEGNDKHLRQQSFGVWAATSHLDDLPLLQSLNPPDDLGDHILRARLERSDSTAIPELISRIRSDGRNYWWYQARNLWSDDLTSALDEALERRGNAVGSEWKALNSDSITSELIVRRDCSIAEALLCKHWSHLRRSPLFIQAALHVGSPRLRSLVDEAIEECPSPSDMFEHINFHFGIRTIGHPGVTRIEQVEGLIPYLDHIDESAIYDFWLLCNERGWIKLRREHLDARLGKWRKKAGLDDATLLAELDEDLIREMPPHMDFWVDRQLDNGRSMESILGVVREWLKSNRTTKALEIAASIVTHAGTRADIDLLNEGSDQSELAEGIIADSRFAVRRRTLS